MDFQYGAAAYAFSKDHSAVSSKSCYLEVMDLYDDDSSNSHRNSECRVTSKKQNDGDYYTDTDEGETSCQSLLGSVLFFTKITLIFADEYV